MKSPHKHGVNAQGTDVHDQLHVLLRDPVSVAEEGQDQVSACIQSLDGVPLKNKCANGAKAIIKKKGSNVLKGLPGFSHQVAIGWDNLVRVRGTAAVALLVDSPQRVYHIAQGDLVRIILADM